MFALTTAPILVGGAWVLLPEADGPSGPAHAEDTVEASWYLRATSGAFTDLIIALGLAVAATPILDTPDAPLLLVLVLGFADAPAPARPVPARGRTVRNSLRKLGEAAGMSQQECADALGITRQTVISIEKGHFDPRLSLAFRIGRVFSQLVDAVFHPDPGGEM